MAVRVKPTFFPLRTMPVRGPFWSGASPTPQMAAGRVCRKKTSTSSSKCWSRFSALGCVAPSKVFAVGYDSGADVANHAACTQAHLIDATATVTGENTLPTNPLCTGPAAALLIHDEDDPVDAVSEGEEVRDGFIDQNFCVADGFPEPVDPEPCVSYSGRHLPRRSRGSASACHRKSRHIFSISACV
jgi:hypothetical protein